MIETETVVSFGGTPVPKGSLKCIGARGGKRHQLIEDNANTDEWRRLVASIAAGHFPRAHPGEAVGVEITSTLPRPQSHQRTGRFASELRDSAPRHPTTRGSGDVDKLARLVLDALQDAGVVVDDAQVVEVISRKAYPNALTPDALPYAGVRIRVYPYGAEVTP